MGVVFRNSEFINEQDLVIKCSNRSFSYGDGFFEVTTLMVGIGLMVSAIMPLIISAALKTHID